jgi:hypothetical protein
MSGLGWPSEQVEGWIEKLLSIYKGTEDFLLHELPGWYVALLFIPDRIKTKYNADVIRSIRNEIARAIQKLDPTLDHLHEIDIAVFLKAIADVISRFDTPGDSKRLEGN